MTNQGAAGAHQALLVRALEVNASHTSESVRAVTAGLIREGTLAAAKRLTDEGIQIVGVPKTVDNDLAVTDTCPSPAAASSNPDDTTAAWPSARSPAMRLRRIRGSSESAGSSRTTRSAAISARMSRSESSTPSG